MSWQLPHTCFALFLALLLTSACATDDGTWLEALRAHAAGETPQRPPGTTDAATQSPIPSETPDTAPGTATAPDQTPSVPTEATPTGPTDAQPTPSAPPTTLPTTGGPPTETPPVESTTPVDAPVEVISIDGLSFVPNDLTVAPNTLVRWQNQSGFGHTVVSGEPGEQTDLFEITVLDAGGQGEFLFTEVGEFPYFSIDFQTMTGIVRVE